MKVSSFVLIPVLFTIVTYAAEVSVTDAVVRGMPPGQEITAAFFSLHNNSTRNCEMVSVETNVAARAELHNHIHEAGMMRMRQVDKVTIPAGEAVFFQPGSLHVMMFGLRHDLVDGATVSLSLGFNNCEDIVVDAKVQSARKLHGNHH